MVIWYKVNEDDIKIEAVEVIRETPARLHYYYDWSYWGSNGRRETTSDKVSAYHQFYPTFKEAQAALVSRLEGERDMYAAEAKRASNDIATVLDMGEPAVKSCA